ncbi:acetyltransferase [Salinibacterium sp. SYSU T00001]|uniref:acyltransferase family protein n=1 Tax=Homoserinimonas sedimenticola TaxID=2986805 RepID=UPI0022359B9B|nr:acyltransferase family protein [Salinibacterium sedimenticola]MCW4385291.1 acetyltransferase [Salinibacterium sedimenticola]
MTATPSTTELSPASAPRGTRFGGLDGLRAIAVILVIVYHLGSEALPGGFLGVDLFFVISGFLITSLLLREKERNGRIRLGDFWRRRARRLLPAIALVVLVCSSAALIIGGDVLIGLGVQVLGAATFSSNWLALAANQGYFDEATPEIFKNLWSLAVEEQFYLLWPLLLLLVLLVPRRRMRVGLLLAAALASAVAMTLLADPLGDPTRAYFGTDTHSFGLALGAALALGAHALPQGRERGRRTLQLAGTASLAVIIAASAVLHDDSPLTYRGGLAAVSALAVVTILATIQPGSPLARALDVRPLAWVGERSYGLYLWHWPVHVLVVVATAEWNHDPLGQWAVPAISLALTVGAAQFSYVLIERPVRMLGFRGAARSAWRAVADSGGAAKARRTALVVASALAVVVLVAATATAIRADPGSGSVQRQIEAGQNAIEDATPGAPSQSPAPDGTAPDNYEAAPEIPGGDQISAIGDSVMLASATSLQQVFPGIDIDAAVSRQFSSAPELIRARLAAGTLRPIVLLGLGTNGPVDAGTLTEVRELLGTEHQLVLVNVYAPRSWTEGVNGTLTSFAQQFRDVELANWRDSIAPQLQLLARDKIHPGDAGGLVYAAAVEDALQRLAELPPVVGPRDYGLAPQPV